MEFFFGTVIIGLTWCSFSVSISSTGSTTASLPTTTTILGRSTAPVTTTPTVVYNPPVGPWSVNITDLSNNLTIQRGTDLLLVYNIPRSLDCFTSGVYPNATVDWGTLKEQGVKREIDSGPNQHRKFAKKLTVTPTTALHNKTATCTANNTLNKTLSASSWLIFKVASGPRVVTLYFEDSVQQNRSVLWKIAGINVTIDCRTDEVYPNATMGWSVSQVQSNIRVNGTEPNQVFSMALTFVTTPQPRQRRYTCSANNTRAPSLSTWAFFTLKILSGPTILTISSENSLIPNNSILWKIAGLNVTVDCETDNVTGNASIAWSTAQGQGNVREIGTQPNKRFSVALTFVTTPHPHLRRYTCSANNTRAPSLSTWAFFTLKTLSGPTILTITSENSLIPNNSILWKMPGLNVTVDCETDDMFGNASIGWSRAQEQGNVREIGTEPHKRFLASLTFVTTPHPHLRRYTCSANNTRAPSLSTWAFFTLKILSGPRLVTVHRSSDSGSEQVLHGQTVVVQEGIPQEFTCLTGEVWGGARVSWSTTGTWNMNTMKSQEVIGHGMKYRNTVTFTPRVVKLGVTVECRAVNNRATSLAAVLSFTVHVVSGPSSLTLVDMTTRTRLPWNQSIVISEKRNPRLYLKCITDLSFPNVNMNWTNEDVSMTHSYLARLQTRQPGKNTFSTVIQLEPTRALHMSSLICNASNSLAPWIKKIDRVLLNIRFGPDTVTVADLKQVISDGHKVNVVAGDQQSFKCTSSETWEIASVSWSISGSETKSEENGVIAKKYTNIISFTPNAEQHNTNVKCSAHNQYHPTFTASLSFTMMVVHGPTSLSLRPGNIVDVIHGKNVTIDCFTPLLYPDATIQWNRSQGQGVKRVTAGTGGRKSLLINLTITGTPALNFASYKCSAKNTQPGVSIAAKTSVHIRVIYGPTLVFVTHNISNQYIRNVTNKTVEVLSGKTQLLTCTTDMSWKTVDILWTYASARVVETKQIWQLGRTFTKSLVLKPQSTWHGDVVTCSAFNVAHKAFIANSSYTLKVVDGPSRVHITISGRQEVVKEVKMYSGEPDLTLSCTTDYVYPWADLVWQPAGEVSQSVRLGNTFQRNTIINVDNFTDVIVKTCVATRTNHPLNFHLTPSANASVTIRNTHGPRVVQIYIRNRPIGNEDKHIDEGMTLDARCVAEDYSPSVTIDWIMLTTPDDVYEHSEVGQFRTIKSESTLRSFVDFQLHGSKVTCKATNTGNLAQVNASFRLLVHFGPKRADALVDDKQVSLVRVNESDSITLSCRTDDVFPSAVVEWSHGTDKASYRQGMRYYSRTTLSEVSKGMNRRNVTCTAKRPDSVSSVKAEVTLYVTHGPKSVIVTDDKQRKFSENADMDVITGVTYTLNCLTDDVWPGVHIEWHGASGLGEQMDVRSQQSKTGIRVSTQLSMEPNISSDEQVLWCIAVNSDNAGISAKAKLTLKIIQSEDVLMHADLQNWAVPLSVFPAVALLLGVLVAVYKRMKVKNILRRHGQLEHELQQCLKKGDDETADVAMNKYKALLSKNKTLVKPNEELVKKVEDKLETSNTEVNDLLTKVKKDIGVAVASGDATQMEAVLRGLKQFCTDQGSHLSMQKVKKEMYKLQDEIEKVKPTAIKFNEVDFPQPEKKTVFTPDVGAVKRPSSTSGREPGQLDLKTQCDALVKGLYAAIKGGDQTAIKESLANYLEFVQENKGAVRRDEYLIARAKACSSQQLQDLHQELVCRLRESMAAAQPAGSDIASGLQSYMDFVRKNERYIPANTGLIAEAESMLTRCRSDAKRQAMSSRSKTEGTSGGSLLEPERELRKHVLNIDTVTFSSMKDYKKPPQIVHRVVKATLLILGDSEQDIENWETCQDRLAVVPSPNNRGGLFNRITQFKVQSVSPEIAARARWYLKGLSKEFVEMVNSGATIFYEWVMAVCQSCGSQSPGDYQAKKRNRNKSDSPSDNYKSLHPEHKKRPSGHSPPRRRSNVPSI